MGRKRPRLRKLTVSFACLAVLALALPAFASAARVLYASGHPIDTNRLAKFGGNSLTATFDGCDDSAWASALARTDFDVLVVGEAAPGCMGSLSPDTLTAISDFVAAGHPYIQTGAHQNESDFMNAVFGFSTTVTSDTENGGLFGTLQPSATGTPFAGGPTTLIDPSETILLDGTPGTTIYSGPEGVWVFTVPFGAGKVTYLAWDLCGEPDNCGNVLSSEDDWYRVLDRAMFTNTFTIDAVTRNKRKGTATITVGVLNPGELIGSGNGVKAASDGQAVISKSVGAGKAQLLIKAKGKKKKKLNRKGKAKVDVAITFSPTHGSANTQSVTVKLKRRLKK